MGKEHRCEASAYPYEEAEHHCLGLAQMRPDEFIKCVEIVRTVTGGKWRLWIPTNGHGVFVIEPITHCPFCGVELGEGEDGHE